MHRSSPTVRSAVRPPLSTPSRLAAGAALFALLAAGARAQDAILPGFEAHSIPNPGGAVATLSDGSIVAFDGEHVDLLDPSGALVETLGSIPTPGFASFLVVDPSETFCVFGESLNHGTWRLDLAGGAPSSLGTLKFNYDAVFESAGAVLVSANLSGSFEDNDIVRLDVAAGEVTPIAHVQGPSGPIALDAAGNLAYATQGIGFPAPPASTDVIGWTKAQISGTRTLDESDATVIATGFDGGTSMVVDPTTQAIYLAENSAATGLNRVVEVGSGPADSKVIVDGETGRSIGGRELEPGVEGAVFHEFQPAKGGTLRYLTTEFQTFTSERYAVEPARPSTALSGPGVAGPGPFDVTVGGAPAGGHVLVFAGLQSGFDPLESAYGFAGVPLLTGIDPVDIFFVPGALRTDASGVAVGSYVNGGDLHGQFVVQGLAFDEAGTMVATSAPALF